MTAPQTSRIGRLHPAVIVGVAAAIAVALVAVLVLVHGSGQATSSGAPSPSASEAPVVTQSPLPPNAARDWMTGALTDFNSMKGVLLTFTQNTNDWREGKQTNAVEAATLKRDLPDFVQTRVALAKRAPFAQAPRALDDYRQAVTLYLQAGRIVQAATQQPAGALHTQLALSYVRVQDLADRVFDQAAVELAPYLPPPTSVDGVVVTKPAEVPDWASLSLAAGPPLDTTPTKTPVRQYVENRPQQASSAWVSAVLDQQVPSAGALVAGISGKSAGTLKSLAESYIRASNGVYAVADPKGQRTISTRVQLGLLVDSESARSAQASTLATPAVKAMLERVAMTLALVGDDLWDSRLGARSVGYPATLLTS